MRGSQLNLFFSEFLGFRIGMRGSQRKKQSLIGIGMRGSQGGTPAKKSILLPIKIEQGPWVTWSSNGHSLLGELVMSGNLRIFKMKLGFAQYPRKDAKHP